MPSTIAIIFKWALAVADPWLPTLGGRHPLNLGAVYTKRQRQHYNNPATTLQNGFATLSQVSPLISMRTESLAGAQSGRSVDADALCKWGLRQKTYYRLGMVNSKSFISKVLLRIKWKFELINTL